MKVEHEHQDTSRRGRLVHVLTGGCKGVSQVFLSFTFPSTIVI
jgi:hypothetical protein